MKYDISDFQKEVIEESYNIPVLVDFWAEWCGPCKVLGPVLERLGEKYKGSWKFAKLDTDKYQDIAAEYGIRGIPNVKLFINGEIVDEFSGALPEHMAEDWLKKTIPGKSYKQVNEAKILLEKGNEANAKKILEKILAENPEESDAKLLLAKIYLFSDPNKSLALISNIEYSSENEDTIDPIKTISSLIIRLNNSSLSFESPQSKNILQQ